MKKRGVGEIKLEAIGVLILKIVTNVEKQVLRLKMIAKGTALRYTLTTEIGNVSNPKKLPFII